MTREGYLENVASLVRRLLLTPDDQPGLLADRMNDLSVAIDELDSHTSHRQDAYGFCFACQCASARVYAEASA